MNELISRQAVLKLQYRIDDSATLSTRDVVNVEDIEDLPSVNPQYTDDEIQKMQDLEQAEIQKAYELGKPKTGHWVAIDEEPHEVWKCDHCGFVIDGSGCIDPYDYRDTYKFCPDCGARMAESEDKE